MTQRQCRGAAWHEGEIRQDPRKRGSVRFEDAINETNLGTPETRQHNHNANGGRGRRPQVPNDT